MRKIIVLAGMLLVMATRVFAQSAIPVGSRVGSGVAAPAPAGGYDSEGRRDPFVSLIQPKKTPGTTGSSKPATGLAALAVSDAKLTGLATVGGARIAILQGPDGKSFMTKAGDRLHDGLIKRIEADGVVIVQEYEDLLGDKKTKEIKKTMRTEGVDR